MSTLCESLLLSFPMNVRVPGVVIRVSSRDSRVFLFSEGEFPYYYYTSFLRGRVTLFEERALRGFMPSGPKRMKKGVSCSSCLRKQAIMRAKEKRVTKPKAVGQWVNLARQERYPTPLGVLGERIWQIAKPGFHNAPTFSMLSPPFVLLLILAVPTPNPSGSHNHRLECTSIMPCLLLSNLHLRLFSIGHSISR